MAIGTVVTRGYGSGGSIPLVVTRGYAPEQSPIQQYGTHLCGEIEAYPVLSGEIESYPVLSGTVSSNPC